MGPAEPSAAREPLAADGEVPLTVELLWSPRPEAWQRLSLQLPAGSTIAEALRASGCFDEAGLRSLKTGIWGKLRPLDTPLREADRVEVYRPLTVDPKEARRQRYQATGKRIVTRHRPLGKKA